MRKILFYIFTLTFICSLYIVISKNIKQKNDEMLYDNLRAEDTTSSSNASAFADLQKDGNSKESDYQMPVNLAALSDNENVVGWIKIDDTNIDYPIAQSKNDNDFFLHRDIYGNKNSIGSIYLDSINDIDASGLHLIYGHHMRDGAMFHDISNFTNKRYLQFHKNITIWTKQKEIHLLPIYCYAGEADGDYRQAFLTSTELQKFIKEKTGISTNADNVFVLITCSYGKKDERTYLICEEVSL